MKKPQFSTFYAVLGIRVCNIFIQLQRKWKSYGTVYMKAMWSTGLLQGEMKTVSFLKDSLSSFWKYKMVWKKQRCNFHAYNIQVSEACQALLFSKLTQCKGRRVTWRDLFFPRIKLAFLLLKCCFAHLYCVFGNCTQSCSKL